MKSGKHHPLAGFPRFTSAEMEERSAELLRFLGTRRTVRDFADRPVPRQIIENCLLTAASAPSGANMQPWHFEAVSNPQVKKRIREAAETEEREFYAGRAPDEWLDALAPLGTDDHKPFLETAPWLIAIFEQRHSLDGDGNKVRHYYTKESVGLAAGFLIAALHNVGLASLTHTPSPMKFLNDILERPSSEKPFLLLVTGYPAEGAEVPDITRKGARDILNFRE
jgi:iodotyrosine deiodinase